VAVAVVDGLTFNGSWVALALIALILAAVNAFVKPVVKILSFPVILLTLGLFLFVINAAMLWLTIRISEAADLGLASTGFKATLFGAVIISLVTWALDGLTDRD